MFERCRTSGTRGCLSGTVLALLLLMAVPVRAALPVTGAAATPAYWLRADGDVPLLSAEEAAALNRQIAAHGDIHDLTASPERLAGTEVRARIAAAAQDLAGEELPGLYRGEQRLTAKTWQEVRWNCALDAVGEIVTVRYAVAVQRADVRLLPTGDGWYESPGDVRYDSLQGTVLDPGEAVLVLHSTRDGMFAFVESRDYLGWVDIRSLALTDRETWRGFAAPEEFFTVTVPQLRLYDAGRTLLYQLGAKIPGTYAAEGTMRLCIPVRDAGGHLRVREDAAVADGRLTPGRLPLTHNNLVRLAFAPLGTEYGWGGQNEGMDCSSYVQNVYRAMGVELPRDADQQERACMRLPLAGLDTNARAERLSGAPLGALLFRPGHVMLYLGRDAGNIPLVIHDISSYYEDGEKRYMRQVVVSDLTFQNARGEAAINTLDTIGLVAPRP